MLIAEQAIENYLYVLEIKQILEQPDFLDEGMIEKLKDWPKNKIQGFSKRITTAAKNKDISTLKKIGKSIPKMSTSDIQNIGKKVSKDFPSLTNTAEKSLYKLSNKKLSKSQLKAASLAFSLRATLDKNPKMKLKTMLKAKEEEEIDITAGDVTKWVVSAVVGVIGTIAVAHFTGVTFIYGPFILFGLCNMLLGLIFGSEDE